MLTTKARFNYEWTLGGSVFTSDSLVAEMYQVFSSFLVQMRTIKIAFETY